MSTPVVAIVGRPNVGKSTLFNRCAGSRRAIVDDSPGITRDCIYQETDWAGQKFLLVDTGGLMPAVREPISSAVERQATLAVNEADAIIFLVDGKAGIAGGDRQIADLLRKSRKPVILAVNKIDAPQQENNKFEFYELGLGEPVTLSAQQGNAGVGDLLDGIVSLLKDAGVAIQHSGDDTDAGYSVAIVGRPNVGKSSILNCLCGMDRTIVDSVAGTTRDAIDTTIDHNGIPITLIDTAGIRRRSKVVYGVEAFAVVRSLSAIDRSDVSVLVLDATQEVSDQDQKIATRIEKSGKAAVIVLNKWDLVGDRSSSAMNNLTEEIYSQLRQLRQAKIMFVSAINRQRISKILECTTEAVEQSRKRISTSLLNQIIYEAVALSPPPAGSRGQRLKILYSSQVSVAPPTFIMFVNKGTLLTAGYTQYLERKLREAFGFTGACLRIVTRDRSR